MVAQSVEQQTENLPVGGSIPPQGTKQNGVPVWANILFFDLRQREKRRVIGGSREARRFLPRQRFIKNAGVAQLAEQLICNQQVVGSSPITGSTTKSISYGQIPERPNGSDCKSDVFDFGGSNPPLPTKMSFYAKINA